MSKALRWALGLVLLILLGVWIYKNNAASAGSRTGVVTPLDSASSATPFSTSSDSSGSTDGEASRSLPPPAQPQATPATPPPTTASAQAPPAPAATPAADTLSAAPANGMAFGGKGRFQWYRQGNITWRIDTVSGATCIDFATMDEWSKPIVYSHGCSNG